MCQVKQDTALKLIFMIPINFLAMAALTLRYIATHVPCAEQSPWRGRTFPSRAVQKARWLCTVRAPRRWAAGCSGTGLGSTESLLKYTGKAVSP